MTERKVSGFGTEKEEVTAMVYMLDVTEPVGKLRDGGNLVRAAVRDYLGVYLGQVMIVAWEGCDYASTVHLAVQVFDEMASRILRSCPASYFVAVARVWDAGNVSYLVTIIILCNHFICTVL